MSFNPKDLFDLTERFLDSDYESTLDELHAEAAEIADQIHELEKDVPQILKTRLREVLARIERIQALVFFGQSQFGLREFEVNELSDFGLRRYAKIIRYFHATRNNYFALEAFMLALGEKMSPPLWVSMILGAGVARFLFGNNPEAPGDRDDVVANQLSKCLNLTAKTSGGTSPLIEWQRHYRELSITTDILQLVSELGLSEIAACKAVIIKYDLDESISTLKRRSEQHLGFLYSSVKTDHPITSSASFTEYDRTKFIDSFPPKAKTIIRKSCSP